MSTDPTTHLVDAVDDIMSKLASYWPQVPDLLWCDHWDHMRELEHGDKDGWECPGPHHPLMIGPALAHVGKPTPEPDCTDCNPPGSGLGEQFEGSLIQKWCTTCGGSGSSTKQPLDDAGDGL